MNTKTRFLKESLALALAALTVLLTSCSTPPPPRQAYFNHDPSALVIKSLDSQKAQLLHPTPTAAEHNDRLVDQARKLPERNTAVVILENYNESQLGSQFRDRGTAWFLCLRNLGYQHIVFLQGNGLAADGLPLLVRYD
jgi:hypothetical protein